MGDRTPLQLTKGVIMKSLVVFFIMLFVLPTMVFAESVPANCEKDGHNLVIVPKKKIEKKKEEKKSPPVAFVAQPEKEIVKEVIKEVPVIVEKQVIVQVPVPVAAPVVEHVAPAPVASQPTVVRKRPQHVDASHPLDTDGLPYPPTNPTQSGLQPLLNGVALGAGLSYGLSR